MSANGGGLPQAHSLIHTVSSQKLFSVVLVFRLLGKLRDVPYDISNVFQHNFSYDELERPLFRELLAECGSVQGLELSRRSNGGIG